MLLEGRWLVLALGGTRLDQLTARHTRGFAGHRCAF